MAPQTIQELLSEKESRELTQQFRYFNEYRDILPAIWLEEMWDAFTELGLLNEDGPNPYAEAAQAERGAQTENDKAIAALVTETENEVLGISS